MISHTLSMSKIIKNDRTVQDVLCSVIEEVGELGTEVRVKYGTSYKEPGPDGVMGEAIDGILALIDLIYVDNPEVTETEIMNHVFKKLTKWYMKELENA